MHEELTAVNFIEKETRISKAYSIVYDDKRGALELARKSKFCSRMKYIDRKYHHFRNFAAKEEIRIVSIDTKNQQPSIFTKPLPKLLFEKWYKLIVDW